MRHHILTINQMDFPVDLKDKSPFEKWLLFLLIYTASSIDLKITKACIKLLVYWNILGKSCGYIIINFFIRWWRELSLMLDTKAFKTVGKFLLPNIKNIIDNFSQIYISKFTRRRDNNHIFTVTHQVNQVFVKFEMGSQKILKFG